MLVPISVFVLTACFGLFAALRPEAYSRYFLGESQRRALSGNLKALSITGWVIFGGCTAVAIALPFQSKWSQLAPLFSLLFFLVCAISYVWWGLALRRNPQSFLNRTREPWSRMPAWAVKVIGLLLLLGAAGFLYGFSARIRGLFR